MIKLTAEENTLYVKVTGKIEKGDFENIVRPETDFMIAEYGKIKGIIIDATEFDGWEDFPAFLEHYGFIKAHMSDVFRIALIGDDTWQIILPTIANLFVNPEIKRFEPGEGQRAEDWINHEIPTY